MLIGGLQKLSLIDYPGKLCATVFLIGCPFRCSFCYNANLVLPQKIIHQPAISEPDFFSFLSERQGLLEGVCITGGEPCMHQDLSFFIKKIKNLGFLVKLDTNGFSPEMLKDIISAHLVDYIAMDIKGPLKKYPQIAGFGDLGKIKESIDLIKNSDIDYEFRTTILPKILNIEDLKEIIKLIGGAKKYYLQQFMPQNTLEPDFEKEGSYSPEDLGKFIKLLSCHFEICQLRI